MERLVFRAFLSIVVLMLAAILIPALARADSASEIRAAQNSIAAGAEARNLDAIMSNYLHSPKLFVFDVYPPRLSRLRRVPQGLARFPGGLQRSDHLPNAGYVRRY